LKENAIILARQAVTPSLATNRGAGRGDNGCTRSSAERSLVAGMANAHVKCEVISPFSGTSAWLPVFAVRPVVLKRINKTWSTQWHRYWHRLALEQNLFARLSKHQPNAIIAQCPVSARAALNVRRELGLSVPIILVCHFNYSEANEYREKGELRSNAAFQAVIDLETQVLRRVDKVIYVSRWAQAMVENDRGIWPRSSDVIWNGIPGDEPAAPTERSALGLVDQDIVLLNVGSLEPRKNQIGLLDQFARIVQQFPQTKLLLVGDGPDRTAIEKKVAALGLADRVKCLGFRTDVPSLLAMSDLYLHYARLENCPVVLIEAARAGVPAATVPAGGAGEILDAIGAGVLLDPQHLDGSTRAIAPLLADANLRRETGERARAGFVNRFTQAAMVREYVRALQSVGASLSVAEVA
jgi:glycosyltransferase involved in cell wall biosynthesis